jgi:hypothetical protein
MAGTALDRETIDALDRTREIEMRTPRRDGSISSRPTWVVVVDGEAYVRSYRGPGGAWYRRALADRRVSVGFDGNTVDLAVEPVAGEEVNKRVSDAFRAKYGDRSPTPTEAMVAPEVRATTLRLTRHTS